MLRSIYLRDPDGYVIELTAKTPLHDVAMDPATNGARARLEEWQVAKRARSQSQGSSGRPT
jgi:hypothetical protein